MKLHEITGTVTRSKAVNATEHYEKLKAKVEAGAAGFTQRMVDGAKATADDMWERLSQDNLKNIISKHGSEWWELVLKQYPITKNDDGDWQVTSKVRDWTEENQPGPWPFQYKAQAQEKVQQLVKWLATTRKRGFGDTEADLEKWVSKLNAIDHAKTEGV